MGKKFKIFGGIILLFFAFCFDSSAQESELKLLSLDDSSDLGTTISIDSTEKIEGKASLKITALGPTSICLGEISGLSVENARLIFQAKVKCEKVEGLAFLEMWCFVGGGQYFSRGLDCPVKDTLDWASREIPFFLQAGQKADKVTLHLVISGKGTVWIDDVKLLKKPLK